MQHYARMLVEGLRERGHRVTLIQPPARLGHVRGLGSMTAKWLGYVDKFLLFREPLRRTATQADVVHICDHSNAMYVPLLSHRPHVVTCHDLLAVRSALGHFTPNPVGFSGRLFQRLIARGLRKAGEIACVSDKTRDDLEQHLAIPAERLHVVPNALHWPYQPMAQAEREPLVRALGIEPGTRYLLHVGAGHWYKNRTAALALAAALRGQPGYADLQVVFAGGLSSELHASAPGLELGAALRHIAAPTNQQLQALYSGALALLFPSLEEGFGWPILEAQACGSPVVIADRRPMRDIAGGAAILIDPADPENAAAHIASALLSRDMLVERGFENAALYTRDRMLDGYEQLYRSVMQARSVRQVPRVSPHR